MTTPQVTSRTALSGRVYRVLRSKGTVQVDLGAVGTLAMTDDQFLILAGLFRRTFPRPEQSLTAGHFVVRGFVRNGVPMAALEVVGHPRAIKTVFWFTEVDYKALYEAIAISGV